VCLPDCQTIPNSQEKPKNAEIAMPEARVLFVCLGNICRSPTAEGVFRTVVEQAGLTDAVVIDSCGTGGWHIGNPPDPRMCKHAKERGYDLSKLKARKFQIQDFSNFDYILAMDDDNYSDIKRLEPSNSSALVQLMGEYYDHSGSPLAIPDPYYGGTDGFETVLDMLEVACKRLLEKIRQDQSI
jgi:protein-tyrosine phosphatase